MFEHYGVHHTPGCLFSYAFITTITLKSSMDSTSSWAPSYFQFLLTSLSYHTESTLQQSLPKSNSHRTPPTLRKGQTFWTFSGRSPSTPVSWNPFLGHFSSIIANRLDQISRLNLSQTCFWATPLERSKDCWFSTHFGCKFSKIFKKKHRIPKELPHI